MLVRLDGIEKSYDGRRVLRGVDLEIAAGTVHALVGENGAGKSTLGKVLTGQVVPDLGTYALGGEPVAFRSPKAALRAGVTVITQELSLAGDMSVVDNVFLGMEETAHGLRRARTQARRYDELVARAGFGPPAHRRVRELSVADQQKVEVLRALAREARLVVFDEPTAVLDAAEAASLFRIIDDLRSRGTAVVYVSHFLEEVLSIADRVTVLRDGAIVRTAAAIDETPETLIQAMLGRALDERFPARRPVAPDAPVQLSARGVSGANGLRDVSVDVRAGEVVGVAGLVGSGRSELLRALFGADRLSGGEIHVAGRPVRHRSPRAAIANGVALVPESRRDDGLALGRSIRENVMLATLDDATRLGVIDRRAERRLVEEATAAADVRAAGPGMPVSALSGGNQQKVLFAKWLRTRPRVLLADEPTRGVDVGAKRAIYDLIAELARQGAAILLVSSEVEEVIGLSHRVIVMRGGHKVAELVGDDITEEAIMSASFQGAAA